MRSQLSIKKISISFAIYCFFTLAILMLIYFDGESDWHDFDVFYEAASAVLSGSSIYITVGKYNLPFWYLPWTAWSYVPYAIWPRDIGVFLYKLTSLFAAFIVVIHLTRYYSPKFKLQNIIFIISSLVPMSLQLISVGQMDYLLLGLLLLVIWAIERKKDIWVGVLFPFLLVKPHLLIPFILFIFLRTGGRALLISVFFPLGMLLVETFRSPNWYMEMFEMLRESGQRIDGLLFITFPSLIGFQENWIGTANLPLTGVLICFAVVVLWKFRRLPTIPFFSFALVASLFCAPRAYAYDLPLLIPALIWLIVKDFQSRWWLWVFVGLFPMLTNFSSKTYLVVLFVFVFCIFQGYKTLNHDVMR